MSRLCIFLASAGVALMAAAPSQAAPDKPDDRLICKRSQQTGTRFPIRVCHTAEQWAAIEEIAKRAAAEVINRPVTQAPGN